MKVWVAEKRMLEGEIPLRLKYDTAVSIDLYDEWQDYWLRSAVPLPSEWRWTIPFDDHLSDYTWGDQAKMGYTQDKWCVEATVGRLRWTIERLNEGATGECRFHRDWILAKFVDRVRETVRRKKAELDELDEKEEMEKADNKEDEEEEDMNEEEDEEEEDDDDPLPETMPSWYPRTRLSTHEALETADLWHRLNIFPSTITTVPDDEIPWDSDSTESEPSTYDLRSRHSENSSSSDSEFGWTEYAVHPYMLPPSALSHVLVNHVNSNEG
jgi:hypothetical protein